MPGILQACPQCGLENTCRDGANHVCPDCAFEWAMTSADEDDVTPRDGVVRNANGNPLERVFSVGGGVPWVRRRGLPGGGT